jgi:hypothetical protein
MSTRGILARLMQCGFNQELLLATRVEKASECPEIYVTVRTFAAPTNWEITRICGQQTLGRKHEFS